MKNKIKIGITRCNSYDKEILPKSIRKCVNLIGGFEKFIKTGDKIVIKPNLLMNVGPDLAITTHPLFVEGVIEEIVRLTKKSENIVIADSPGAAIPYEKKSLESLYRKTGMLGVAERTGCKLNYSNDHHHINVRHGRAAKKIEIIEPIIDADVIINLPKLKTHGFTIFTGAVKNMFGTVPGRLKISYHMRYNYVEKFSEMLIDLILTLKPDINI